MARHNYSDLMTAAGVLESLDDQKHVFMVFCGFYRFFTVFRGFWSETHNLKFQKSAKKFDFPKIVSMHVLMVNMVLKHV